MNIRAVLLVAAFGGSELCGQEPTPAQIQFPVLPAAAADAEGFVPPGWRVETQVHGDLNGDGAADLAFVLLAPDVPGAPLRSNPYDSDPSSYANPRMLGIALGRREGGYRLALNNNDFLPPKWAPNGASQGWMLFEDGSLDASRGRLRIIFEYTRAHRTFTFAWRQGALRLIGYDSGGVSGGCFNGLSINYLTHRAKLEAGWIDRDDGPTRWRSLAPQPLVTLEMMGEGEAFDPYGLNTNFPLRCPERRDG